jgi:hypothetical protein
LDIVNSKSRFLNHTRRLYIGCKADWNRNLALLLIIGFPGEKWHVKIMDNGEGNTNGKNNN